MNHRNLAAAAAPLLLTAGLVAATPISSAAAAPPTCMGQEATLVGPGTDGVLTGTPGVDVVVTNGATEVDTLAGNDLVCVTNVDGDTSVVTGTGEDAVEMTDGAVFTGASARRAAGAVTIDTGDDDDAFYSYADIRSDGVGPGGTVDLGPGADRARVRVDDSNGGSTPAGTTGVLDLDGGTGDDDITFDTVEMVELIGPEDGNIDVDLATGTAELAGRTQVTFANFDSQQILAAGRLTLDGTDGPDRVVALACAALIRTGPGSDRIDLIQQAPEYADEYLCDAGPIRIYSGAHRDVVRVEAGGWPEDLRELIPVVYGGSGADVITGRPVIGVRKPIATNLRAYGEAGDDRIVGGAGYSSPGIVTEDVLAGGPGNDVIYGYGGGDRLYGGTGRDTVYGGAGRDLCRAEAKKGCER